MDLVSTSFTIIFLFIFGSAIGSFLNVLSDRLPEEESINGRSHCEKCKHTLSWLDLFPVFSFLFLKGRCRYCKTKLSFYYPGVEIITGVLFILTWYFLPSNLPATLDISGIYIMKAIYLVIISALIVVFFADLKFQIIPDSMQVVLLLAAIALRLFHGITVTAIFYSLVEGLVVMAPILLLFAVTKGRGMGFGDVKLAYVIGVLFGIKLGFFTLYLSFLIGAVIGIWLILRKKKKLKSKIAFGPFIVIAMFAMLFFREQLLMLVHNLWGI